MTCSMLLTSWIVVESCRAISARRLARSSQSGGKTLSLVMSRTRRITTRRTRRTRRNFLDLKRDSSSCPSCPSCSSCSPYFVSSTSTLSLRRLRSRRGFAGIQIVPIHDRVEAERVGALRLPAPERTDGKHHHVALAERDVNRGGAIRQHLAAIQRPR